MGLLRYPVIIVVGFLFYAVIVLTAVTLYLGGYLIVFLLTAAAMRNRL